MRYIPCETAFCTRTDGAYLKYHKSIFAAVLLTLAASIVSSEAIAQEAPLSMLIPAFILVLGILLLGIFNQAIVFVFIVGTCRESEYGSGKITQVSIVFSSNRL